MSSERLKDSRSDPEMEKMSVRRVKKVKFKHQLGHNSQHQNNNVSFLTH